MVRYILILAVLTGCQASRSGQLPGQGSEKPHDLPDCRGLAGRVVVLDPGHGGKEVGAVGPDGTEEKVVNLAVALDLADRLRAGGATVHLTRTSDEEVGGPKVSLRQDLALRGELANRVGADLFLSIHHNATPHEKATSHSASETYYRMDDLGPSLEAGRSIHRWLVRGLELPGEALTPGNYSVLRRTVAAAVLGEAAYLTNPGTERILRTPEGVAQEAQAYYYGICDYFAPGIPRIEALAVQDSGDPYRPQVAARVTGGGSPIDPQALDLQIDGLGELPVLQGDRIAWQPAGPLANGDHSVRLAVRNVAGRTSVAATASIRVDAPAAAIALAPALSRPPSGGPLPILLSVIDALGRPVADGVKVKVKTTAGELAQDEIQTRNGQATAYLIGIPEPGAKITAKAGQAEASLRITGEKRQALMGLVTGYGGQPLEGAHVVIRTGSHARASRTNREGLWWFPSPEPGLREIRIWAPGYREEIAQAQSGSLRLASLDLVAGNWYGETVVIDPEGGDAPHRTAGAREQDANWRVAQHLRRMFEAAGARVHLTRRLDEAPSEVVRVRVANEADATLFIRIGHPTGLGRHSRALHYYGNKSTAQVSERITANLADALGTANGGAVPDSSFALYQTSAPGVVVYPSGAEEIAGEALEVRSRRAADAIFRGLLPPQKDTGQLRIQALSGDTPVRDALVRLDGAWIGQTDADGIWTFPGTLPGQHTLSIDDGRRVRFIRVVGLEPGERRQVRVDMSRPEVPEDLS
jgi:N-acetylmuramoyl-L-alanine amidase